MSNVKRPKSGAFDLGPWTLDLGPSVAAIRRRWTGESGLGVILGTGLGDLANEIAAEATISYRDIPGFPCSTALAHKGCLVCGTFGGRPIIALQGRCHLYEGYRAVELGLPVRVLAGMGVQTLIVTNAAGGLNPGYSVGDVMAIDDHICLMGLPSLARPSVICPDRVARPSSRLYDEGLIRRAREIACAGGFPLQCGVYVGVTGPSYETRAEYRAFRRLGGDCVGMSTVPEVLVAARCGMRVLGLSTVTNVARPDAPKVVSAEEVVEVAVTALPKVRQIIHGVLAG